MAGSIFELGELFSATVHRRRMDNRQLEAHRSDGAIGRRHRTEPIQGYWQEKGTEKTTLCWNPAYAAGSPTHGRRPDEAGGQVGQTGWKAKCGDSKRKQEEVEIDKTK